MVSELISILEWIKNNLPSLLPAIAALITAIAAWRGVNTWKNKISYERKMGVVDSFYESVHTFCLKSLPILDLLSFLKTGIESYEQVFQMDKNRQKNFVSGLHEYIERGRGEGCSVRLRAILEDLPIERICMLWIKIKAFHMKDVDSALNCYLQIKWFYEQVVKIANLLEEKNLYWENPRVKEIMGGLYNVNPDVFKKSLNDAHALMEEFSKNNYK